jgi:riboflavin kinase/FMN adenylyltransferase
MEIIRDYHTCHSIVRSSLTIGNFDGIHQGHQRILEQVVQNAATFGTRSMVVSFQPHPLTFLHPAKAPQLIIPADEKIELMRQAGIDLLVLLNFDQALANLSGESFVREVLSSHLRVKHLLIGNHFLFGHKRSGNVELLKSLGAELDYTVQVLPEVIVRRERVSSTWIRQLIQNGRISMANRLLGRFYTLRGNVVSGQGIGRKLLFPTLNLHAENDILPKMGVYVTLCRFGNREYPAITNIGRRPTLEGRELTIETHLLNVMLNDPPTKMDLAFLHRLRNERKFATLDELRRQIERDCRRAWHFFKLINRLQVAHGHLTVPPI